MMNSNTADGVLDAPAAPYSADTEMDNSGYRDTATAKVITKRDLWHIGFRGLLMELLAQIGLLSKLSFQEH